jgi:hypothetical protein
MAKKISLALYQLSINKRGDRNNRVVLSDFMNGTDIIDAINDLLNTLRYTSSNEDVSQNRDEEKFFRIMKRNGQDLLFSEGRYVSGIIETGDYGTEENIVNIQTGEATHTKSINESLLIPFYFLFYIPEDSQIGFLLLQRIGNLGVYSLLESKLRGYLAPLIKEDEESSFVLKINSLVLQRLITRHLGAIGGGAKKITFEQVRKEDLKVSRMTNGEVSNEEVGNTEIVYTAKRNSFFNIRNLLNRIQHVDSSNVYSIEGVEYGDVKFEVIIEGQSRQLSVRDIEKLGTFIDITDNVQLAPNNYPTYESLNREAHLLTTYILNEIQGDN